MTRANIHIRTLPDSSVALGWTNGRSVTIDRGAPAGGLSIGFNGGELLCLAVGACYTNELFIEANRRGIRVRSVHVDVGAEFGGDAAGNVTASVRVEADADGPTIAELVEHADKAAQIPNLLRLRTSVRLTDAHMIGTR